MMQTVGMHLTGVERELTEKIRDLSEELGHTKDPYQVYRIAGDLDAVTRELRERRRSNGSKNGGAGTSRAGTKQSDTDMGRF